MTEDTSAGDSRAQHVAAAGFFLQLAAFVTLLVIGTWQESAAVNAGARFVFAALPIWVILYLVFKQVRRVRDEQLETDELQRAQAAGDSTALFELDDEAILLEQNRLRWMVRWLLPATTVVVAVVLLGGHFVWWGWLLGDAFKPVIDGGPTRTHEPHMMMWFVVGVGFVCFLYARYAIALARLADWRLLHAAATAMAANALVCLSLAVALMAGTTVEWAEPLVSYVIRVAMILLGLELTVNFVLDFYRPRQPGVVARPSFDSRLLGLATEPGGFAKSIADGMNYQFGFEVSSTWFYQLLQRWLFPMMVATAIGIVALTSIVIVDADEQAVVERFGRLRDGPDRVLTAGLHLKLPYPIEIVRRAPVKRIDELVIGEAAEEEEHDHHEAVLWTEAHEYLPELMLLVAAPRIAESTASPMSERRVDAGSDEPESTRSVAVSLLMVSVPIEYRIKDIHKYLYNYDDPRKLMEAVAYQYLSDRAASVDIDMLIGPGRAKITAELRRLIQRRLDELDVGIEVAFVAIREAHPPAASNVAATFQNAVSAQTNMAALINAANGEARKILTKVAGTERRARALDAAIRVRNRLQAQETVDSAALADAEQDVEALLMGDPDRGIARVSGQAIAVIANARSAASKEISRAAAKVRTFSTEVAAYRAAPALYVERKRLDMYTDIDHIRKYVILGDPTNVIIEYETMEQGGLDRVLSEATDGGK